MSGAAFTVNIKRDGVLVSTRFVAGGQVSDFSLDQTPGAGVHQYTMEILGPGDAGSIGYCKMLVVQAKR